ncbi:peptide ABC transporter substrate-binding protein [Brevibacillus daliensis]|uniref:peptide ABC transporter substrate-binding protein n=1 Tax=Brevibacillus daliensis TaxID=2892995 RepID=UPI001E3DA56A|nr:peptide ABC transporter substrate-binding protein [Brevibacillus daliensis]
MNHKGMLMAMSALLTAASLLGTGTGAQANKVEQKQVKVADNKQLQINLSREVVSMDPALAEDAQSFTMVRATFDGLTRTDAEGKIVPSMAKKIDVSEDMITYTFHLRDAKWSNGDPVTAYDFEYAWKRVLSVDLDANYSYQLFPIKNAEEANFGKVKMDEVGIKVLDDKTLQVILEKPTPYFLELTSFSAYYPVNKKVVEKNKEWAYEARTHVGNGPFKLDRWEHEQKMTLVKNENYWDKDAVKLESIEGLMIEDEEEALALFDKGGLDWIGQPLDILPGDTIPALKKSGKLQSHPLSGVYWYKFNVEQAPFNNAKIRKAFAYAIDRKQITDEVLGLGQIPAMSVIPPTMTLKGGGYFKDNDKETAKKLLKEGMKELGINELPPIALSFNTSDANKKIANAVQKKWKETLGVDVKLQNKEWKVHLEDMHNGNYQIARLGWNSDFTDPINFLEMFKEKENGNNDTRWEHPQYKKLLDESDKEKDPKKRKQLLAEAEAVIINEMPVVPIYFNNNVYLKNEKLNGFVIDGVGTIDFKWAYYKE